MEILFLLLPLSILLVCIIVALFIWAVNHDQFNDLVGPAHRILHDDDSPKEECLGSKTREVGQ